MSLYINYCQTICLTTAKILWIFPIDTFLKTTFKKEIEFYYQLDKKLIIQEHFDEMINSTRGVCVSTTSSIAHTSNLEACPEPGESSKLNSPKFFVIKKFII